MWNGFYILKHIKDIKILKQLFYDALDLSSDYSVQHIPDGWTREIYNEITAKEYIDKYITLESHNVVINRFEYNQKANWADKVGEIGSSTMSGKTLYLFIYLSLDNLELIVEKYKLTKNIF